MLFIKKVNISLNIFTFSSFCYCLELYVWLFTNTPSPRCWTYSILSFYSFCRSITWNLLFCITISLVVSRLLVPLLLHLFIPLDSLELSFPCLPFNLLLLSYSFLILNYFNHILLLPLIQFLFKNFSQNKSPRFDLFIFDKPEFYVLFSIFFGYGIN